LATVFSTRDAEPVMTTMTDIPTVSASQGQTAADALKGWVMVALTMAFVLLYGAALAGWLKPLPDEKMVTRLEPIIFVIVGYYFGRMPAQQNEKTLKGEIGRLTQKADAAQHAKEQAQQSREALEEKVNNVRAALTAIPVASAAEAFDKAGGRNGADALRGAVAVALEVLKS
jgi:hypothetical protein